MIVGAHAVGGAKGLNYIRAEYPLSIEIFQAAIGQAREAGLLGKNILGTGFDFDIEVVEGAGAYVCGEETSLLTSIEGQRAMPRVRPPFPVTRGLYGKPTVVNNVETWANVPRIVELGAAAFADVGTATSRGTKIFSLAGSIRNAGAAELPMGVTLRQIIYDVGGGMPRGRRFKAAQVGGPCGGCVPAQHLDLPVDYDSLRNIGAMMGCGGIIVLDQSACMVDLARNLSEFARDESCGKCVPCRLGNTRILEILTRMTRGEGHPEDLGQIRDLCELIHLTSLCGMAPNPVLSTIRFFREEYEAHVTRNRCPAKACRAMAARTRRRGGPPPPERSGPSSQPDGKGV
jgi:NADH:ubiquinone oxidoreductase subunit F (NADH-binding)